MNRFKKVCAVVGIIIINILVFGIIPLNILLIWKNFPQWIMILASVVDIAVVLIIVTNAISPQISLKAAAMQAISVFWMGLVFGAICYRSERTIWASVLIHAILDFSAFVASGILVGITQEEAIGATGRGHAITSVIYVIWFLYLMRSHRDEEE